MVEPVDRETFEANEPVDDELTFDDLTLDLKRAYQNQVILETRLTATEAKEKEAMNAKLAARDSLDKARENVRAAWEHLSKGLGMPVPNKQPTQQMSDPHAIRQQGWSSGTGQ